MGIWTLKTSVPYFLQNRDWRVKKTLYISVNVNMICNLILLIENLSINLVIVAILSALWINVGQTVTLYFPNKLWHLNSMHFLDKNWYISKILPGAGKPFVWRDFVYGSQKVMTGSQQVIVNKYIILNYIIYKFHFEDAVFCSRYKAEGGMPQKMSSQCNS